MDSLMSPLLVLHNAMRWVVVILAIYALVRMYMGIFGKRDFTEGDRKSLSWFAISMDIQLVLGLVLYFWKGYLNVFQNMANAMGQAAVRFFAVEHITLMIVAVILAHLAVIFSKRAQASAGKFKRGAIYGTLAVLALFFAIPWPWMAQYGPRPWIRLTEVAMMWFA